MIFVRRRGLKFLVFCSRSLIFPKQISAGAPLRVSEPNCTLPCPMPEPIPYGYTNASGEWRCDQGAGGTESSQGFPVNSVERANNLWMWRLQAPLLINICRQTCWKFRKASKLLNFIMKWPQCQPVKRKKIVA